MIDPTKNWAVAIVHGIGTTEPQKLLGEVTKAIATSRTELQLEPHTTIYESADPEEPGYYQRCGKLNDLSVRFAAVQWSDISVIREGLAGLFGGILIGGIGAGYFVQVATDQTATFARTLGFLLRSMIYVLALAIIPLTFFSMVFSASSLGALYFFPELEPNSIVESPYAPTEPTTSIGKSEASVDVEAITGANGSEATVTEQPGRVSAKRANEINISHEQDRAYFTAFVSLLISWTVAIGGIRRVEPTRIERPLGIPMFVILAAISSITAASLLTFHNSDPNLAMQALKAVIIETASRMGNSIWALRIAPLDFTGVLLAFLHWLQVICALVMVTMTLVVLSMNIIILAVRLYDKATRRSLVFATASVISIWMLFLLLLWPENLLTSSAMSAYSDSAVVIKAVTWKLGEPHPVTEALDPRLHFPLLWYEVAYFALIGLVILLVIGLAIGRGLWKLDLKLRGPKHLTFASDAPTFNTSWPRFILPNSYQFLVLIFMGVVSVILLSQISHQDENLVILLGLDEIINKGEVPHEFWAKSELVKVGVILFVFAFLLIAHRIRYAIKLLLDVVNHFTRPKIDFPIRRRIANRLTRTLNQLLPDSEEMPNLVIIAHSQGTVISLDALLSSLWQKELQFRASSLTLLTFGSPITHVYQHYFHNQYGRFADNSVLRNLADDDRVNWFNCYRIDDYVGTYIDQSLERFPVNVPLKAGGHTNYWAPDVFKVLFEIAGMDRVLRGSSSKQVERSV